MQRRSLKSLASWTVAAAAAIALLFAAAQTAHRAPASDPARGEVLYAAQCGVCHALDANRVGPAHRGVVGRRAARSAGFAYSSALQRLDVVWTRENLDRWLTNPPAMAPGTAMGITVPAAQDRADIIAYLETQGSR